VEFTSAPRRYPSISPLGRGLILLLLAGFAAFHLGRSEVTPGILIVGAAIVALIVAIQLVPRGAAHVRKPELELELKGVNSRVEMGEPAILKRVYSPPQLTQFESREFSELAWESPGEDKSFQVLKPFYLVCPKREFAIIAASLKFQGEKDHRGWQPVANSAPPQSHPQHSGEHLSDGHPSNEHYEWILLGYVPANVNFDATLKLRNPQAKLATAVLRDLVATQDRPFQSVHLKLPAPAELFATSE
jgi:hypothetical protein